MKIPCSNCNQRLEIAEELAGQTIDCPACNATLAVPALETPPSTTPRVEVVTPQASSPQKPAPQRKTAAQREADSSQISKSPIPMEAIAAILGVVVVVLILMFSSKPTVLMLGTTLIIVGSIGYLVLNIMLLIPNFKKNVGWGLLSIFLCTIPLHVFAIMHFREVKKTYLAFIASIAVTLVGYAITASVAISATSDAVSATVDFIDKHTPDALEQSQLNGDDSQNDFIDEIVSHSQDVKKDALRIAAIKGNINAVKNHIDTGTDLNARDNRGITPLMWAANWGHEEIVELLIAAGADVNAKEESDRGLTALDIATNMFKSKIVEILKKHGGKTSEELKAEAK